MRTVESDWQTYSSASGMTIGPRLDGPGMQQPSGMSFIAMDPPDQTQQRKTVRGISAPSSLRNLEDLIRERTAVVLDELPEGETFDWVEHVSVELTTLLLATLFDFPLEDRRLLTWWSDVVTSIPGPDGIVSSGAERDAELGKCLAYFDGLWSERRDNPGCLLYTSPSPRDATLSRMPSSA